VDCVESRVNLIVLGVKRQGCFRSGLNRLVLEMVTIVLNVVRLAHFGDRKEKLVWLILEKICADLEESL
jgi:hypothetical protein